MRDGGCTKRFPKGVIVDVDPDPLSLVEASPLFSADVISPFVLEAADVACVKFHFVLAAVKSHFLQHSCDWFAAGKHFLRDMLADHGVRFLRHVCGEHCSALPAEFQEHEDS